MTIELYEIIYISTAMAALFSIFGMTWIIIKPIRAMWNAQKAQIQYSITRAHNEYKEKGNVGNYTLKCLIDMYTQYKAMGGNGHVDKMMEDIKLLPIVKE